MSVRTTSKRPYIFLGVGIINTLLDFLFYTFLTAVVFNNEHLVLAGLLSGTFALFCAFLTHGLITWRGSLITHKTLFKFFAFTGFGMWIIRPLLLSLFIKLSGIYTWIHDAAKYIGFNVGYDFIANTGAFGFMLMIVLVYNYYVYGRFVFDNIKSNRTEPKNHSRP